MHRRTLHPVLSHFALAALIFFIILQVASYWTIFFAPPGGHFLIGISQGRLWLWWAQPGGFDYHVPGFHAFRHEPFNPRPEFERFENMKLFNDALQPLTTVTGWLLNIPIWPLILLLSPSLIPLYKSHRAKRRIRRGQCANCGYSIAGLPTPTCPECGRSIPS